MQQQQGQQQQCRCTPPQRLRQQQQQQPFVRIQLHQRQALLKKKHLTPPRVSRKQQPLEEQHSLKQKERFLDAARNQLVNQHEQQQQGRRVAQQQQQTVKRQQQQRSVTQQQQRRREQREAGRAAEQREQQEQVPSVNQLQQDSAQTQDQHEWKKWHHRLVKQHQQQPLQQQQHLARQLHPQQLPVQQQRQDPQKLQQPDVGREGVADSECEVQQQRPPSPQQPPSSPQQPVQQHCQGASSSSYCLHRRSVTPRLRTCDLTSKRWKFRGTTTASPRCRLAVRHMQTAEASGPAQSSCLFKNLPRAKVTSVRAVFFFKFFRTAYFIGCFAVLLLSLCALWVCPGASCMTLQQNRMHTRLAVRYFPRSVVTTSPHARSAPTHIPRAGAAAVSRADARPAPKREAGHLQQNPYATTRPAVYKRSAAARMRWQRSADAGDVVGRTSVDVATAAADTADAAVVDVAAGAAADAAAAAANVATIAAWGGTGAESAAAGGRLSVRDGTVAGEAAAGELGHGSNYPRQQCYANPGEACPREAVSLWLPPSQASIWLLPLSSSSTKVPYRSLVSSVAARTAAAVAPGNAPVCSSSAGRPLVAAASACTAGESTSAAAAASRHLIGLTSAAGAALCDFLSFTPCPGTSKSKAAAACRKVSAARGAARRSVAATSADILHAGAAAAAFLSPRTGTAEASTFPDPGAGGCTRSTRCWAGCCGGRVASGKAESTEPAVAGGSPPASCNSGNRCGSEQRKDPAAGQVIPRVGVTLAGPRPDWFHVPAPQTTSKGGEKTRFELLQQQIRGLKLHTVCEEAKCPNIGECWNGGTATLMLLGDTCTRGCRFCAIKTSGKPPPPDPREPEKVAAAVAKWDVDYLVLTSVDRDDMPDGGAEHFARTVRLLKQVKPEMLVECLVSDFLGAADAVRTLACSGLDVYAHNVETVRRLTPFVRDRRANYCQSLRVLQLAKQLNPSLFTKSSIMVGLGETESEVIQTLTDLRAHDVDVVTFGQYLRPTKQQLGVVEYVTPQTFAFYQRAAEEMGFKYVASGPLIRSSYKAGEYFIKYLVTNKRDSDKQASARVKLKADVDNLKGNSEQIATR